MIDLVLYGISTILFLIVLSFVGLCCAEIFPLRSRSVKIWFMFDNHTFCEIKERDVESLAERASELFLRDGCGSLFARDEHGRSIDHLTLHGERFPDGKYGQTDKALRQWALSVVDTEKALHDYTI